jgi:hypothetical protein
MVEILPQSNVWANPKIGFTKMHEDGNLKNRIGVQVSQIEGIEVKEAMEKGRNGQTQTPNQERDENHRFMGILRGHDNPLPNPSGTHLLRRKNSDLN